MFQILGEEVLLVKEQNEVGFDEELVLYYVIERGQTVLHRVLKRDEESCDSSVTVLRLLVLEEF